MSVGIAIAAIAGLIGAISTSIINNLAQGENAADRQEDQQAFSLEQMQLAQQQEVERMNLNQAFTEKNKELDLANERILRQTQYQDWVQSMKASGLNVGAIGQTIGQPQVAQFQSTQKPVAIQNVEGKALTETAKRHMQTYANQIRRVQSNNAKAYISSLKNY